MQGNNLSCKVISFAFKNHDFEGGMIGEQSGEYVTIQEREWVGRITEVGRVKLGRVTEVGKYIFFFCRAEENTVAISCFIIEMLDRKIFPRKSKIVNLLGKLGHSDGQKLIN